nr:Bro-N domain-containing protein [Bacillus pseudomycoides]
MQLKDVLGQAFKVYGTVEEPLFLAKDVKTWIDHKNITDMMSLVDEDEKVLDNVYTLGGNQQAWFLTEDGIYEVLMMSRKPIAKQWKKEVKKILKQIRLTGGAVQEDREEEFIHNYFPSFSEEVKKAMVLDLREQNKQLQATIEEQSPMVEKYKKYLETDGTMNTTSMANAIKADGVSSAHLHSYIQSI